MSYDSNKKRSSEKKPLGWYRCGDLIHGMYKNKEYLLRISDYSGTREFPYLEVSDGDREVIFSASQWARLTNGVAFGELIQEVLDFEKTKQGKENWKWRRIGRESAQKEFRESQAGWNNDRERNSQERPDNTWSPDGNM